MYVFFSTTVKVTEMELSRFVISACACFHSPLVLIQNLELHTRARKQASAPTDPQPAF